MEINQLRERQRNIQMFVRVKHSAFVPAWRPCVSVNADVSNQSWRAQIPRVEITNHKSQQTAHIRVQDFCGNMQYIMKRMYKFQVLSKDHETDITVVGVELLYR